MKIQIRGTENRDGSCIAFQQRFDFKLYMWEFEHFIEWGLEKRPGSVVNAQHDGPAKKIVCRHRRTFDRQTPCLNHRDYHSWNLMIQNEAVRVIDFSRRAHGATRNMTWRPC